MLSFRNITLRRGNKVLFSDVNLLINSGEKTAIVGKNGVGKSSFFGLIRGDLAEDEGEFSRPNLENWHLAEVAQDMPDTSESATDFVIGGDSHLMQARKELAKAEENDDGEAIAHAHALLYDSGEYDVNARAQTIILGLGFQTDELEQPVNSFSGGWRMRLQLARALLCKSNVMLLDEPTNHLDLPAMIWLEKYLQRYDGTLLIISHDREFLDAIVKTTIHLEAGKITRYGGNYSTFEILRAQKIVLQQSQFQKQQLQIDHFTKFINRFRAQATKARQAQSRIKALERMEKIAPVITDADFSFEFPKPDKSPNPLITITDADFGYVSDSDENKVILNNIDMSVVSGQRIGILGANGQGKSTFIKTISEMIPLLKGQINCGKGLNIGYFAQHELDLLNPNDSPLQHYVDLAKKRGDDYREVQLRTYLGSFNFTNDMVNQKVGTMSGGEKSRLVLSMIVWQKPNLLLLDEPTNHLDIVTREALAMALNEFSGTVLLVSHDRSLLSSVCDEFWLIGQNKIINFDGDLDDYRDYLFAQEKALRKSKSNKKTKKNTTIKLNELKDLKREFSKIETNIKTNEQKIATLEQIPLSGVASEDRAEHARKIKKLREEAEKLESRWLEIYSKIETS